MKLEDDTLEDTDTGLILDEDMERIYSLTQKGKLAEIYRYDVTSPSLLCR